MKINEKTAISNSKLLLVPYSKNHVETYHEWMKDPSLQAATASEPLSLDEEYAMQRSWRTDHDKLTFIICSARILPTSKEPVRAEREDEANKMIGDINLFLSEPDNEDDEEASVPSKNTVVGEIELMIARMEMQRNGYGRAAILLFTDYVLRYWEAIAQEYSSAKPRLAYFRVKINQSNAGSIKLFEGVGFEWVAETANYFGEVELRWPTEKARKTFKDWRGQEDMIELDYSVGDDA